MCEGIESHFPFTEFRPGQRELLEYLCQSLEGRGLTLIEAPNGIGKTVTILTAMEYLSQRTGAKFLYLVRTHSQIDRVLDECERFDRIRVAALRGKRELCLNRRANRTENYHLFNKKCEELRESGKCPFFSKRVRKEPKRCFDPLAMSGRGCPYYNSLRVIGRGNYDVVVASYAYIMDEDLLTFVEKTLGGKRSVLIDEGHNLKKAWLSNYLITLERSVLASIVDHCNKLRDELLHFKRSKLSYVALPNRYFAALLICEGEIPGETKEIINWLRAAILSAERTFLTKDGLILLKKPQSTLEELFSRYESVVLISGTWGGKESEGEFQVETNFRRVSVTRWGRLKAYITRDFTTRFEERSKYEYYRLATTLADLSHRVHGNIGVFASSYDVVRGLLDAGLMDLVDIPIFVERSGMRESERSQLIDRYKRSWRRGALLLGVQGGRNSEGEDFPGPYMSTSVVVGLQLMRPGIVRDLTLSLWRRHSRLSNPELLMACRTAAQAAARPIRSSDDLGFIVLADNRFGLCLDKFPEWLRRSIRITSLEEIPRLADEFFNSNGYLLGGAGVPLDGVNSSTFSTEGKPLEKGYRGISERGF